MRPLHSSRRRSSAAQRASVAAWLAAMLGAAIFAALTALVGVWTMLRPNGEVATLRDSAFASASVPGRKEMEFSVGPVLFGIMRAGLNLIELEPEVRSALRAIRGTSVGVYRLEHAGMDPTGLMQAADEAMSRRGWERVAGVLDQRQCVLAYIPARVPSTRNLPLSVLVWDGDQLVATSVRADPEPLIGLLLREAASQFPRIKAESR